MDEFTELLRTVAQRRSLTRRQLRLAVRRRGFVRMWAPDDTVVDDWHSMVMKGVSRAELTPRGREMLDGVTAVKPKPKAKKVTDVEQED